VLFLMLGPSASCCARSSSNASPVLPPAGKPSTASPAGRSASRAEEMEHLGDDRLGRALDRLFDADRAALLTEVVLAVAERFGVKL